MPDPSLQRPPARRRPRLRWPFAARGPFPSPRALLALGLVLGSGCKGTESYRIEADEAVYRILAERRAAFTADPASFRIEPSAGSLRQRLLAGEVLVEPLGLVDCLVVASENSRTYQDRRESLYRSALDLTFDRWRFHVQETGNVGGFLEGTGGEGESFTADGSFGLTKLLGTGALIVANLGLSTIRLIGAGATDWTELSDASLSFTQPLLRGFGTRVVKEPLTQSERDVVYEVRAYERFRRTFAVDVANRFFRILQQFDTLANQRQNAENLDLVTRRSEALAEAGQLSEVQADQARQDKLRADNDVITAQQQLEFLLDDFKFFLGLPIESALDLDYDELETLSAAGLQELNLDPEEVVAFGLEHRLDYHTVQDRVEDVARAVYIAADALRPGLDLRSTASASGETNQPFDYDVEEIAWTLDLDLELPFERLPERNAYRAALIGLDAVQRDAVEFGDGIRIDLRDSMRNLASLRESHRIQQVSVQLAERRVASTNLNFEAGRAEIRDLLDAQESLVQAQNAETRALVDYYLATLALSRDMETLRVDESGLWSEPLPSQDRSGEERN